MVKAKVSAPAKAAAKKFKVIDVAPEDIPATKANKKNQSWVAHDTWPGSASVVGLQRAKKSMTITFVIEEDKPNKK